MNNYPAPAKLNLFLHVVGRRTDGYHLLQSLFTFIDFCDELQIKVREDGEIHRDNAIEGIAEGDDLAVRAARALQAKSSTKKGADIRLEKRIPKGGGLGGGSSDAATTLLALNRLWGCGLSLADLQEVGLQLGADVPVFIAGKSALAEGIGEVLTPVQIPDWWYIVLTPPVNVPTAAIFTSPELTRNTIPLKMSDFSAPALERTLAQCKNDLQAVAVKEFPVVETYLKTLHTVSAKSLFDARMTGSGACVFAAFETERDARTAFAQLPAEIKGFVARGMNSHPMS